MGLTEIAGLDIDGRIWAIDCNHLKKTIERFYQLTGTYNSFESVLCLKTYEIHIYNLSKTINMQRVLLSELFTDIRMR